MTHKDVKVNTFLTRMSEQLETQSSVILQSVSQSSPSQKSLSPPPASTFLLQSYITLNIKGPSWIKEENLNRNIWALLCKHEHRIELEILNQKGERN